MQKELQQQREVESSLQTQMGLLRDTLNSKGAYTVSACVHVHIHVHAHLCVYMYHHNIYYATSPTCALIQTVC